MLLSRLTLPMLTSFAQVHYASVDHIPQEGDDSGVFLQYTEQVGPMLEQKIQLNNNLLKEWED